MISTVSRAATAEPLMELRYLRSTQAWTLLGVAIVSVAAGVAMLQVSDDHNRVAFAHAVGWQFLIWGAIDLVFAVVGIVQSVRNARRAATPQAEADEFAAGEKLLRSLQFNHRLNIIYLGTAALLLIWAVALHSPALAGHGVGVLVQGGFLFAFDLIYIARYARLMTEP